MIIILFSCILNQSCKNKGTKKTNDSTISNFIDTTNINYIIYENIINNSTQREIRKLHLENKKLINFELYRINNERDSMYVSINNTMDSLYTNIEVYQKKHNMQVIDTMKYQTNKINNSIIKQDKYIEDTRKQNNDFLQKETNKLKDKVNNGLSQITKRFDSLRIENNKWKKSTNDSLNKSFKNFQELVNKKLDNYEDRLIVVETSVKKWETQINRNSAEIDKLITSSDK